MTEGSKRLVSPGAVVIVLGLLSLLLVILCALSSDRRAAAAFPGRDGEIAFSAPFDGDRQIFVMRPDGSHQRVLTHDSLLYNIDPAMSSNGKEIVFADTWGRLSVINIDGSDQHVIASPNGIYDQPAFSPGGGRIVFQTHIHHRALSLMRVGGTHQRRLTGGGKAPTFSPDGKWIAFHRNRQIHVIRPDGSHEHPLTHGPRTAQTPSYSPDGRRIAFVRNLGGNREIYVMSADGTHQHRLTHDPAQDDDPAFSPSGKRIVFSVGSRYGGTIYRMNADGTNRRPLADAALTPDWGPRP